MDRENSIKVMNVLDAWLMEEIISEGTFTVQKGKTLLLRKTEQAEEKARGIFEKNGSAGAVAVYCDVFEFRSIADRLLRIPASDNIAETKDYGRMVSFVLFFDRNLQLLTDSTFVSGIGFVRIMGHLPEFSEFEKYKQNVKNELENHKRLEEALEFLNSEITESRFYMETVNEPRRMNSFFAEDLMWARKNTDSSRLRRYILGHENFINFDDGLNDTSAFYEYLRPERFPLGLFPGKLEYGLSLMQQIAVNIATADEKSDSYEDTDNELLSVNGPPGTGKTTLLKDIFAQLVVGQAYQICLNPHQKLVLNRFHELPENITSREIVVASSNNGAVQNIVKELPRMSEIKNTEFEKKLREVDYFYNAANSDEKENDKDENSDEKWGLFSLEAGKKENLQTLLGKLENVCNEMDGGNFRSHPDCYRNFMEAYLNVDRSRSVMAEKAKAVLADRERKNMMKRFGNVSREIASLSEERKKLKAESSHGVLGIFRSEPKSEEFRLVSERLEELKAEKKKLNESLKNLKNISTDSVADCAEINVLDMSLSHDEVQKMSPWFREDYRKEQSELFIMAMDVRRQFLYEHREDLREAVKTFKERFSVHDSHLVEAAYHWINFAVPVISSTFASFGRMFSLIGPDAIGRLFIDEAGQANPYYAVGGILRSRKAMALGDPSQITPVVTADEQIISLLRKSFDVPEKYLSDAASIQTLMDHAGAFGYERKDGSRIGIPLWVHHRCMYPMFTISNVISYDGQMVQGSPGDGRAAWYNIGGKSDNHVTTEQADFLKWKLLKMKESDDRLFSKMSDAEKEKHRPVFERIYIITPFRSTVSHLVRALTPIGFVRKDENGKPINIGTVHTFQGKQDDIVFLVFGAGRSEEGAVSWATESPNIVNVAATRAKKEFYLLGDLKALKDSGGKTIADTLKVIEDYQKAHENTDRFVDTAKEIRNWKSETSAQKDVLKFPKEELKQQGRAKAASNPSSRKADTSKKMSGADSSRHHRKTTPSHESEHEFHGVINHFNGKLQYGYIMAENEEFVMDSAEAARLSRVTPWPYKNEPVAFHTNGKKNRNDMRFAVDIHSSDKRY